MKQLVFRRPRDVSLYSDYDPTHQLMVMNRLRNEGPFTGDFALAGFCVERIRQPLD